MKSLLFGFAGTTIGGATLLGVKIRNLERRNTNEKLHVVMDLDHTLLHAQKIDPDVNAVNIYKPNYVVSFGDFDTYRVYTRPFATLVLFLLSRTTNLHLFTAGDREYVEAVFQTTNWNQYFQTVTTFDDVDMPPKDLTVITNSRAILVDDKKYNNQSGQLFYHIPQYKGYRRMDYELLKLLVVIIFTYNK